MSAADRLDAIAERAEEASEGSWEATTSEVTMNDRSGYRFGSHQQPAVFLAHQMRLADATFIAHARTDVPALVAALRAVLDLHRPVEWQRANPETGELDEPSPENALNPFCRECTDDEYVSAVEYGDTIDLGSPVVYYPCPTVRAITTALGDES